MNRHEIDTVERDDVEKVELLPRWCKFGWHSRGTSGARTARHRAKS